MTEKRNAATGAALRGSSESRRPAPPEATRMPSYEVRTHAFGKGLFALRPIAAGTLLFGEDEWVDETERQSFITITTAEFNALPPARRAVFARFGYNTTPDAITGTFHPDTVRPPPNFANH